MALRNFVPGTNDLWATLLKYIIAKWKLIIIRIKMNKTYRADIDGLRAIAIILVILEYFSYL